MCCKALEQDSMLVDTLKIMEASCPSRNMLLMAYTMQARGQGLLQLSRHSQRIAARVKKSRCRN